MTDEYFSRPTIKMERIILKHIILIIVISTSPHQLIFAANAFSIPSSEVVKYIDPDEVQSFGKPTLFELTIDLCSKPEEKLIELAFATRPSLKCRRIEKNQDFVSVTKKTDALFVGEGDNNKYEKVEWKINLLGGDRTELKGFIEQKMFLVFSVLDVLHNDTTQRHIYWAKFVDEPPTNVIPAIRTRTNSGKFGISILVVFAILICLLMLGLLCLQNILLLGQTQMTRPARVI